MVGDRHEQVRCGRQVVDAGQPARFAEKARQATEVGTLRGIHGEVVQACGETRPDILIEIVAGNLRPAAALGELEILTAWQVAPGQGNDAHGDVQAALAIQVIERRKQFVQGQITGAAEHHNVARDSQYHHSPSSFSWAGRRSCSITTRKLQPGQSIITESCP
ncbi:hypothetical protein D9M71_528510 [compost metagenome]